MIEVLSMTFAAGEVKTFQMPAEYFEVLDCMYPIDVLLMQRDGTQLSSIRNAEASYFTRPGRFETYTITSANAQTVRWFIGSGDAGTRRTAGVVQVVDGGKGTTLAGRAFIGTSYASGNAGQFMAASLWNPAGSGKNLRLKQLRYDVSINTLTLIHRRIAANAAIGALDNVPVSKLAGGAAASAGRIYTLSNALAAAVVTADSLGLDINPTSKLVTFQEPIIIPPGQGYLIAPNAALAASAFLSALFEFVEDDT